jgi:hypothetical protein
MECKSVESVWLEGRVNFGEKLIPGNEFQKQGFKYEERRHGRKVERQKDGTDEKRGKEEKGAKVGKPGERCRKKLWKGKKRSGKIEKDRERWEKGGKLERWRKWGMVGGWVKEEWWEGWGKW